MKIVGVTGLGGLCALKWAWQPDSLKTERPVGVETDGQTDMARSTRLVMLIKNNIFYGVGNVSFTALQSFD